MLPALRRLGSQVRPLINPPKPVVFRGKNIFGKKALRQRISTSPNPLRKSYFFAPKTVVVVISFAVTRDQLHHAAALVEEVLVQLLELLRL